MHLARSVIESAQLDKASFDSIPDRHLPASDDSPSSHRNQNDASEMRAEAAFPSQDAAMSMIEIFFNHYQVQYPILDNESLIHDTQQLYQQIATSGISNGGVCIRFMLHMIFAISLLTLSKDNPRALTLAESFHGTAMADLTAVMQNKSLETLQCLFLLLLYSLLNSSAAPIWYISGLCTRMCIDLGLHSERTIRLSQSGVATDYEIDCKRRLFWVTYTFDRTLGIILGRPFTIEDKIVDVEYPSRSLRESKRLQVIHWIKLQRLLSAAVTHLYTVEREGIPEPSIGHPESPMSAWIKEMTQKLTSWNDETISLADTTGHTVDW